MVIKKEIDKWWVKKPRSRRQCLLCFHLYSSHIDVRCLKIIQRHPRKECDCKIFIGNERELEEYLKKQNKEEIEE